MQPVHPLAAAIVPPQDAPTIRAFGDEAIMHLTGRQTGGKFTMFTLITPPGGGPPPHYHLNEEEWFFPIEGRVEFFREGAWTAVPVGSAVFMPRGIVHTFRNVGDKPLRQLIHTSPSGFETFFERCAAVFARPDPTDMAEIVQISAEHGIHYVQ